MGRSSKFSFPLSGKRTHPGQQDPPHEQQLSKAEKILGTSGLAISSSPNTSRPNDLRFRQHLHPMQPTVTSAGEYTEAIHFSFGGANTTERSRYAPMRRQASSDVLGSRRNGESGTQSSVTSSSRSWALKNPKSSSTLKSFYDPEKLPLPISQQTSESAIRDMALRKGKPIVIGKRPSQASRDEVLEHPTRTDSASTVYSRSQTTTTARRPPRLDLSRLFAKSHTTLNVTSSSPSKIMDSPSAMSCSSEHVNQQSPHFGHRAGNSIANGMKSPVISHKANALKSPAVSNFSNTVRSPMMRSGSKLLKGRPSTASLKNAYHNRFLADNERSKVKQNIYRPPQGAKNWFDGLLEEEDEFDEEMETEASTTTTRVLSQRDYESDIRIEEEYPDVSEHFYPPVEDHFSCPDPAAFVTHPGRSQRESRGGTDDLSSRPSTSKRSKTSVSSKSPTPPHFSNSPVSQLTGRRRHSSQTRSILASSDLGDTSILSLSSSDEESEDGDSIDSRLPRFRNSIQVSDIDSIVIGQAQAFRIATNNTAKITREALQRRRESVASAGSTLTASTAETNSMHSSITGSTYLAVPSRENRPRRRGHTRQPSSIPEDNDKPTTPYSSGSPHSSKRSSTPGDAESVRSEPRKMMAVTEEEEALLEMMRSKRAAMAKPSASSQHSAVQKSISSLASSTSRPTRSNRPTSTSSSILDSFPISRSQRSSLMAANLNVNSQHDLLDAVNASAAPTPIVATKVRPESAQRQRTGSSQSRCTPDTRARPDSSHGQRSDSTQSRHTSGNRSTAYSNHHQRSESIPSRAKQHSNHTSATSSMSAKLEHSYPALPPHLSLTPLNINLSPIPTPTYLQTSNEARTPSPEPFSGPSTPQTRRGSADVLIRALPSRRNSLASFGHLVHATEHTLHSDAGGEIDDAALDKETQGHVRRRTASSDIIVLLDADDEEEEFTIYTAMTAEPVIKSKRIMAQQQRRQEKKGQTKSVSATTHTTSTTQAENLDCIWERTGDNVGLGIAKGATMADKVGGLPMAGTRCSVSEDVLAAWGSLGGWRDISI